MFTLTDICNIAIQIEQNGAETYKKASKTAQNPHIAKTLSWMAEEEEKHAEWFASIRSNTELSSEEREMEAIGRSLLQDIVKSNTFSLDKTLLESSDELSEILAQSVEFEQDTIIFYGILLDFLDNQETIEKLQMIIQEEKNHVKKLAALMEENDFSLSRQ